MGKEQTKHLESADFPDPAFWSFNISILNTCKSFPEFSKNRSEFIHAGRNHDFLIMIVNLPYRRNNGCGTADTDFGKFFDLLKWNLSLFNSEAKILLCNIDK